MISAPLDLDPNVSKLLETFPVKKRFSAQKAADLLGFSFAEATCFLRELRERLQDCPEGPQLFIVPHWGHIFR